MTHSEDVACAQQPIPTRRRDWTDALMAERMAALTRAKRQRDNAIEARNRAIRAGAHTEQLAAAVRLAEIELMGAVDAANAAWATVEAERDGFVLVPAVTP